jgi:polysaccharide biosynthesis transport protein
MNDKPPSTNSLIGRQIRSRRALAAAGDVLLRAAPANDEPGRQMAETADVDPRVHADTALADRGPNHDDRHGPQLGRPAYAVRRQALASHVHDDSWRPLIDPRVMIEAVLSARRLIVATSLLGFLLACLFAWSLPKYFYSAVEILVDPRDLRISDRELLPTGLPYDASLALVENQTRILTSRRVMERTVDALNLEQDGEFNGRGTGAPNPLKAVRDMVFGSDADDPARAREIAIESLAEATGVSRTPKTFVLLVSVRSEDAAKSALIANTLADAFLAVQGDIQIGTVTRANTEIGGRLDELRADVEKAERLVETYKSENELFDANGKLISDDEILLASTQLTRAREKVAELRSRADSARQLTLDQVLSDALPEGAASNLIAELRRDYAQKVQQVDSLAQKLGDQHPQLKTAQAEAASAARAIETELRRLSQTAQIELQRAVQTEQELAASQARLKSRQTDISERLVRLRELEREAAARRNVYEGFLLRARETGEQAGISTSNITIVSQAVPALRPYGTSRKLVAVGGLIGGFMLGVMLALLQGLWRSIRAEPQPAGDNAPWATGALVMPEDRPQHGTSDGPKDGGPNGSPGGGPGGGPGGERQPERNATDDTGNANGRQDMMWTPAGWMQPQPQMMAQPVMPMGYAQLPQMPPMMHPAMMQPAMQPVIHAGWPLAAATQPMMQPYLQPMMPQPVPVPVMMQPVPQHFAPQPMSQMMMQPMPQAVPQPVAQPAPPPVMETRRDDASDTIRSRIGALRDSVVNLAATRDKLARLG